jgi:hypothetical protein
MGLALSNTTIDKYFGFLTKLDNSSKKKLIVKLTESIEDTADVDFDLSAFYGAWEDSRSSDEIIKEIKDSRIDKNDILNF